MRTLCAAALAAATVLALQATPTTSEVVVIVDSEGPVADGATAARLREQALDDLARRARPIYYDLRVASITRVPEDEHDSFRRAPFGFQPPVYSGVSLDFGEACEILRKNEAIRDTVIRRECSRSPAPDCGGAVHAAATMLVAETEAGSARKLRHLAEIAAERRGASLVIVTAGWAYRDEERLGLQRTVGELRSSGSRLVVLRVPSLVPYRGLVRDASETLASRLSAPFMALTDVDVVRARQALAAFYPPEPLPATPWLIQAIEPQPLHPAPEQSGIFDDLLRRAATYVARFERTFSSVIWRERYVQEDRVRRRFAASGTSFSTVAARRILDSELLFVWLPADRSWIAVRDVIKIDGKPVPAAARPLPSLLAGPTVSVAQLRRLAAENGRFNIGGIVHTFNEPTLALLFLDDHYRDRFAFARRSEQPIDNRRVVTYEFAERVRPTVIQDRNRDVPVRGTFQIDAETGRVLQTSLEVADIDARLWGSMTVRYGRHPRFDVDVPVEMRERYSSSSGEEVTTTATYSDFRRFETGTRLLVPK